MSGAPPALPRAPVGRVRAWQGAAGHGNWEHLGGWRQQRDVKLMVIAIPEASSYRDQGEDCVDHTSSYGGICWLPYPRRLKNAG